MKLSISHFPFLPHLFPSSTNLLNIYHFIRYPSGNPYDCVGYTPPVEPPTGLPGVLLSSPYPPGPPGAELVIHPLPEDELLPTGLPGVEVVAG